jgi:hypothetical protein
MTLQIPNLCRSALAESSFVVMCCRRIGCCDLYDPSFIVCVPLRRCSRSYQLGIVLSHKN